DSGSGRILFSGFFCHIRYFLADLTFQVPVHLYFTIRKQMSSKSSMPVIFVCSAEVPPFLKRLSISLASVTSIIEEIAFSRSVEYFSIFRPSFVSRLKSRQRSLSGSFASLQMYRIMSRVFLGERWLKNASPSSFT